MLKHQRGKIQKSLEQLRSALTRQTGHKWFWNVPKGSSLSVMFPDRFRLRERVKPVRKQIRVWPEGSTSDRNIFREAATHKHRTELREYAETTNPITVRPSQKPMDDRGGSLSAKDLRCSLQSRWQGSVRRVLYRINPRKVAAGLDSIPGRVLTDIFNTSLHQAVAPQICYQVLCIIVPLHWHPSLWSAMQHIRNFLPPTNMHIGPRGPVMIL